jgi:hypothetical protein
VKQQSAPQFPAQDPVRSFLCHAQRSVRVVSSAAGNSFRVGFFCPPVGAPVHSFRFLRRRISQRREFCFRVERRSDFSAARISQRREFCFRVERAESLLGQAQLQAPLIPTPVSQQVWLFFLLLFLVRR